MPMYSAYGLLLESELKIPELAAPNRGESGPDVFIRLGKVPQVPTSEDQDKGLAIRLNDQETVYSKGGCGRFLVRDGREIVVDPDDGVEARVVRLSLFGPALALILIQRGFLALHGGAVAFPEGTVILLGPSGAGKSTLTGELCRQGGKLFSDDVVVVDLAQSVPRVMPGVPLLKLWPDAVEEAPEGVWTRVLHPNFNKVGRRVEDVELSSPAPVSRVFVLAAGKDLTRMPLSGAEAFRPLMASLFAARYGDAFLSGMDGLDLLAKISRLLQYAPAEILCRPCDRGLLPDTAALIIDSLNSEMSQ